jgi:hypothetical protein
MSVSVQRDSHILRLVEGYVECTASAATAALSSDTRAPRSVQHALCHSISVAPTLQNFMEFERSIQEAQEVIEPYMVRSVQR